VLEGAELTKPEAGTPQGGVISPLLANIYLNDLDHLMAQTGMAMERYADDFVVHCRTREEAERALATVQEWTARAGLTLHPSKTRLVDLGQPGAHLDFLGHRLQRHTDRKGNERILRRVRPKSLDRIKDAIRTHTPRKSGESLTMQIARLNPVLRGWFGCFRSVTQPTHAALDKMVRRRLRSMLCKRVGWSMPWERGEAQKRWPKACFNEQGLFSPIRLNTRVGGRSRAGGCAKVGVVLARETGCRLTQHSATRRPRRDRPRRCVRSPRDSRSTPGSASSPAHAALLGRSPSA